MVYDKIIKGKFVTLRSITEEDAEFSYEIRNREGIRETVGQLAPDVETQRAYIKNQMDKPGDYYFVIVNRFGERVGLLGIYDIHDDIGEIGRLVSIGEPVETYEAQLLLNDFINDVLGLKKVCYVIYSDNKKHVSDIRKSGGNFVGMITRGGREALYFEDEVVADSDFNRKVRRMIDKLAKRNIENN